MKKTMIINFLLKFAYFLSILLTSYCEKTVGVKKLKPNTVWIPKYTCDLGIKSFYKDFFVDLRYVIILVKFTLSLFKN